MNPLLAHTPQHILLYGIFYFAANFFPLNINIMIPDLIFHIQLNLVFVLVKNMLS